MKFFQDGAQFYDDETGKRIAEYPHLVHGDFDMPGATAAREQFVRDHPQYAVQP